MDSASAGPAPAAFALVDWQHIGPEPYSADWFQAIVKRELPGGMVLLHREVREDRRHVKNVKEGQLNLPGGSSLQWGRYLDPSSVDDCLAQSILRVTQPDGALFIEVWNRWSRIASPSET